MPSSCASVERGGYASASHGSVSSIVVVNVHSMGSAGSASWLYDVTSGVSASTGDIGGCSSGRQTSPSKLSSATMRQYMPTSAWTSNTGLTSSRERLAFTETSGSMRT